MQTGSSGCGRNYGYILNIKSIKFPCTFNVGCERREKVKMASSILGLREWRFGIVIKYHGGHFDMI